MNRELMVRARRVVGTAIAMSLMSAMPGCHPGGDFGLNDLDGRHVSLAGLRGKTVLVTFWAVG